MERVIYMRCYKCGCVLTDASTCPNCGADVTVYRRILHLSDFYYNDGLEKARVRDLTGAAESLARSLKYNKLNTEARNLLGLVYFETGRVGNALSEWIISANIRPENNAASRYLKELQNDREGFEKMNHAVKRYNQSIKYLKDGSDDLAILQLRKAVSANTKLTIVYQLLALLLMRNNQLTGAKQCLQRAQRIDRGDIRTQKYLAALKGAGAAAPAERAAAAPQADNKPITYTQGNETIIQPAPHTWRDGNTLPAIVNILIGVVIGAAVVWFLIVPSRIQAVKETANQSTLSYSDDLASKDAQISDLNKQLEKAQTDVQSAQDSYSTAQTVIANYEQLISMNDQYKNGSSDAVMVATALAGIDREALSEQGKALYDTLKSKVSEEALKSLYASGRSSYLSKDYAAAIKDLEKAKTIDASYLSGELLWYLASAYNDSGDTQGAKVNYEALISLFPGTDRATDAQSAVNALGN